MKNIDIGGLLDKDTLEFSVRRIFRSLEKPTKGLKEPVISVNMV